MFLEIFSPYEHISAALLKKYKRIFLPCIYRDVSAVMM